MPGWREVGWVTKGEAVWCVRVDRNDGVGGGSLSSYWFVAVVSLP